jgi:hypothetical protein
MNKLQFYLPPLSDAYGTIAETHFRPIEKHLPKDLYEIKIATGKAIKEANERNDARYVRVSFTLGDFFPAVFITHGMADKGLQNVDDLNKQIAGLYPGPAYIDKLVNEGVPKTKLHIIGYPRLDPVFKARKKCRVPIDKVKILWVPTHNAHKPWTGFEKIDLRDLFGDCCEFVESVHPHNRKHPKKTSLKDLIDADIVISDTSSMLYEALSLGIPVILTKWVVKNPVGFEKLLYTREKGDEICWIAESPSDLSKIVTELIKNGFQQGPAAKNFMEYMFPETLRGKSGKVAADTLINFL